MKSGEVEQLLKSYTPKMFTEEWVLYEKIVKVLTLLKMDCDHYGMGTYLSENITRVLDVMAPRAQHLSKN